MTDLTLEQSVARVEATEEAIALICEGVSQLRARNGASAQLQPMFQSLAQGLELLAKVTLFLGLLEQKQIETDLKSHGHDTAAVVDEIVKLCRDVDYPSRREGLMERRPARPGKQLLPK